MNTWRRALATTTFVAAALTPIIGTAQEQLDPQQQAVVTSSSSTTSTTLIGGIILTVMLATDNDKTALRYLQQNNVALHQDISAGAGDTIDDLAHAFGVGKAGHGEFGQLLRRHRHQLLALIEPTLLDEARAREFVELVLRETQRAGLAESSSARRAG